MAHLKRCGAGTRMLLPGVLLMMGACKDDPLASFRDLSATSSPSGNHSHVATISSGDIDEPPLDGRTYRTTVEGSPSHSHGVSLIASQLQSLQQENAVVDVVTDPVTDPPAPEVQPHTHTFVFQR